MNAKIFVAAMLAMACTFGPAQIASAAPYTVIRPNKAIIVPKPNLRLAPLHVACAAYGSPEFVHYAMLKNDGPRQIPAGSEVHWVMGKRSGNYDFTADLPRNKSIGFDLHFTTSAAHPCTATFVK